MYGQKCNGCRLFYSRPFPFFYADTHPRYDRTMPWRDIVTKAIDLFVRKQTHAQDLSDFTDTEDDVTRDVDNEYDAEDFDNGDGPHDTELCQMCQYLHSSCVRQ